MVKKWIIAFLALTTFVASAAVFISGNCAFWGSVQIGSTVFNSLNVPGMILWLDVNRMGLANNADIEPFTDYSSNQMSLSASATFRATNVNGVLNGYAGAHFDGVNDAYNAGPSTTNQQFTMQFVLKFDSATGTEAVYTHGAGTTTGYRVIKDVGNREGVCRVIAAQTDGVATTAAEVWSFRRTSAPNVTLFINRTNVTITNPTSTMSNPTANAILAGWDSGGVASFGGYLFEVRIWDNDIGFINESNSFTQLCNKYALP